MLLEEYEVVELKNFIIPVILLTIGIIIKYFTQYLFGDIIFLGFFFSLVAVWLSWLFILAGLTGLIFAFISLQTLIWLFIMTVVGAFFIVTLIIPDPLPFIDEIISGLVTLITFIIMIVKLVGGEKDDSKIPFF